jgi:hypothetical protein
MIIISLAALCYLVSILNFDGPLTFKQIIIDILAGLGIILFIMCLFGFTPTISACFGGLGK